MVMVNKKKLFFCVLSVSVKQNILKTVIHYMDGKLGKIVFFFK